MVVLKRETHECLAVLQNKDFTVLVLIRDTHETLLVQGTHAMARRVDATAREIGSRRELPGFAAAEDSSGQHRVVRRAPSVPMFE